MTGCIRCSFRTGLISALWLAATTLHLEQVLFLRCDWLHQLVIQTGLSSVLWLAATTLHLEQVLFLRCDWLHQLVIQTGLSSVLWLSAADLHLEQVLSFPHALSAASPQAGNVTRRGFDLACWATPQVLTNCCYALSDCGMSPVSARASKSGSCPLWRCARHDEWLSPSLEWG